MSGLIVVGVGPGIGSAVARRFAREGLPVGLVARSRATVDAAAAGLATGEVHGAAADAADETALRAALDALVGRLGVPDAVVYNAAVIRADGIGDLDAAGHLRSYATNVVGALTTAAHLLPAMAAAGHGSFLLTGGMPVPVPEVVSLSLGKAAVRALTELLAAQYGPAGVHVATVTVAGAVAPGTDFDPDDIAEHYWRLHTQSPGAWEREVVHAGRPVPAS